MLEQFYPYCGLSPRLIFAIWDSFKIKKKATRVLGVIFWVSLLMYFPCFLSYYGFEISTLLYLARDIVILVGFVFTYHLLVSYKMFRYYFALTIFLTIGLLYFLPFKSIFNSLFADDISNSEGELLVDIKNVELVDDLEEALKKYDAKLVLAFPHLTSLDKTELDDYYIVDIKDSYAENLPAIIEEIYKSGTVDWVERNEVYQLDPIETKSSDTLADSGYDKFTNDPEIGLVWGYEKMNIKNLI